MAGTTGLEPAASAVTGQRSNQLNYVPTLFSYLYRKPACLLAFLRFRRFACVVCLNPIEPNSEVNRQMQADLTQSTLPPQEFASTVVICLSCRSG